MFFERTTPTHSLGVSGAKSSLYPEFTGDVKFHKSQHQFYSDCERRGKLLAAVQGGCHTGLHDSPSRVTTQMSHFTLFSFFFPEVQTLAKQLSGRREETPERLDFKVLSPLIIGETRQKPLLLHNKSEQRFTSGIHHSCLGLSQQAGPDHSSLTGQVWTCRVCEVAARSPVVILEGAVRSHVVEGRQSAPRSRPCLHSAQSAGATTQVLIRHFSQQLNTSLPSTLGLQLTIVFAVN